MLALVNLFFLFSSFFFFFFFFFFFLFVEVNSNDDDDDVVPCSNPKPCFVNSQLVNLLLTVFFKQMFRFSGLLG